jgi:hypothetical protein
MSSMRCWITKLIGTLILLSAGSLNAVSAEAQPQQTPASAVYGRLAVTASRANIPFVSPGEVTFVLVDDFPDAHVIMHIWRTPGRNGNDFVIIKRRWLTSKLVLAGAKSLNASIRTFGQHPTDTINVYFSSERGLRPTTRAEQAWAQGVIDRLLRAAPQQIPGIGDARAITARLSSA